MRTQSTIRLFTIALCDKLRKIPLPRLLCRVNVRRYLTLIHIYYNMESPKVHQFVFCVDNSMLSNSQSETLSYRILANLPLCFHRVESLNNIFFGKLFCFRHNVERDIRSAISKAITSLGVGCSHSLYYSF